MLLALIVICAIVGFVSFILIPETDGFVCCLVIILCIAIMIPTSLGLCKIDDRYLSPETLVEEKVSSEKLVCLSDTVGISGNFFLGCGEVNSQVAYIYYVETERGRTAQYLNIDNNVIFFKEISTNEDPYIEKYTCNSTRTVEKKVPAFITYLGHPDLRDVQDLKVGDIATKKPKYNEEIKSTDYYIFYIPEGSIKENYQIDMS